MRKDKCIKNWLDNNFQTSGPRSVIVRLLASKHGKLSIAASMLNPFIRRLDYLKEQLESGSCELGYKTRIEEVNEGIDFLIIEIEDIISIFYKRDHHLSLIKNLVVILDEAKKFKLVSQAKGR
jgi:hypothetical protein